MRFLGLLGNLALQAPKCYGQGVYQALNNAMCRSCRIHGDERVPSPNKRRRDSHSKDVKIETVDESRTTLVLVIARYISKR